MTALKEGDGSMYLPLQYAQHFMLPDQSPNQLVQMCHRIIENGGTDAVLSYMYFMEYMENGIQWPSVCEDFQSFCSRYGKNILSDIGGYSREEIEKILNDSALIRTCVYDMICPYLILDGWNRCKQVYCFDAEMEVALADTEEIALDPAILERLPYKEFYIEFSRDGIFSSFSSGCFVKTVRVPDGSYGLVFIRTKNAEGCVYHVGSGHLMSGGEKVLVSRTTDCPAEGEVAQDWQEFAMFALNAILYLCAANSQIEENPLTKGTYRPYSKPKNKFSEVRKWDVGVRYGNKIRLMRTSGTTGEKAAPTGSQAAENGGPDQKPCNHRSPRAHMRRAHWHHYRIGRGRKEIVLKWIEPVFVGVGESVVEKHLVD